MFDVFHALGTLTSRRDKLKSSMISIIEFLGPDAASFFNLFKAIINSFKHSTNRNNSKFKTPFDCIPSLPTNWIIKIRLVIISKEIRVYLSVEAFNSDLVYCEGTFSDIHYLRI
ncbi:hypothetical protein BpHYR1_013052 [Brachionus plicatilis]|uniref:Uncharacterized protein n=1 Tax=Brachionus plicatilis TaxID=10195 RepID=A0A3M7PQA5_BRAPC|nr:hypothetical protein BpHYR1_013052 [Brachionus plicatilis]